MRLLPITLLLFLFSSCCSMELSPSKFEREVDGKRVELYTLRRGEFTAQICNYGARLVTMIVPDRDGVLRQVCWREPAIDVYLDESKPWHRYTGAVIGRTVNRTGNKGRVVIEGKEYQLALNKGDKSSHGGFVGLSGVVWDGEYGASDGGDPQVVLRHVSPSGADGYPGELTLEVTYTLCDGGSLDVAMRAVSDETTIVSLTLHPYFNLHGTTKISSNSHVVELKASRYTPSSEEGILTGEILSVDQTPLDFRTPRMLGERVDSSDPQISRCSGYDTNYLIDKPLNEYAEAAKIYEPSTGISMSLSTDQPAVHLYGGAFQGKAALAAARDEGRKIVYGGIALEAQGCPNAINCPNFPSVILQANEEYSKRITFNFSVN